MTRKHFQNIAATIRRASLDPTLDRETVETVARSFASDLARTNQRFDRSRFLTAALAPARPRINADENGYCLDCGWPDVLHCANVCPERVS